jgi:hypothetical protein
MDFLHYIRERESNQGFSGPTFAGSLVRTPGDLREAGYRTAPEPDQMSPHYQECIDEAQRLFDKVLTGNRWAALQFQEAMTMSDFPGYFGDILDRSILANYAETPYTWRMYCKATTINDFRQAKIFRFDRGASVLDGPILPNAYGASGSGATGLAQVSEYPLRKRVESNYVDQLYKFGARMDFAWETLVNDDLDALKDTPALFGRAARRTEEKRATELFVTSTGPNTAFFNTANKNRLTVASLPNLLTQYGLPDNPHFSVTALQAGMNLMANQRDLDGEPISIDSWCIVYPPSLEVPVKNVLHASEIWANDQGGTIGLLGTGATQSGVSLQRLLTDNWAKGIVAPAKNYYLPVVNTTSGNTAWYLFASPNSGRPALQQSMLRGQSGPQMFMKAANSIAIGEGNMGPGQGVMPGTGQTNPMDGDFETDSILYKIRHVLGGTLLDPIMAVASSGVDA